MINEARAYAGKALLHKGSSAVQLFKPHLHSEETANLAEIADDAGSDP